MLCVAAATSICVAGAAHAQSSGSSSSVAPAITPTASIGSGAAPVVYAWTGTWFSNHYGGGYTGVMTSLGGSNLWSDGFVARLDGTGGQYGYVSGTGDVVHVGTYGASVMFGYRKRINDGTLTVFLGPSFETHQNSDPTAALKGTQAGGKVFVDYSTKFNSDVELDIQGGFATPFSAYSATARLLYQIAPRIWVGPQATLYGNNGPYQEGTFGGFLKYTTDFGEVGISSGYRHPFITSSGSPAKADGYFASVYLGFPFK